MKSGNLNFLEPPGPLQASKGTDLLLPKQKHHRRIERKSYTLHVTNPHYLYQTISLFYVLYYLFIWPPFIMQSVHYKTINYNLCSPI